MRRFSVALAHRLREGLDPVRYQNISPDPLVAPIVAFRVDDGTALEPRLRDANIVVSLGRNQIRVSPAAYNTEEDIDLLIDVLNAK